MSCRLMLLMLAALLGAGCGTKPPEPKPVGPETCNNSKDDNGDGKIDCLDPKCFQDAACRGMPERCDNDVDDNGDSLADCADPTCAGQTCGFSCLCIGGVEVINGMGGGTGGSSGGGAGGGSTGGGTGGGAGDGGTGGGTGGAGGGTGGAGGGSGGGTPTGGGGGTPAGGGTASGGGAGGGTGGGGGTASGGGGGAAATEMNCNDNVDNDNDNATDCDDANCVGITCGFGCVCALNRKTETNCSDGASNDGDAQIDCADSDCVGVGTEICNDGTDNDCDRAIDCGDSSCNGSPQCVSLQDGAACLLDNQCAGQKCFNEAASGVPNGVCANLNPCTPGTNAGCNGGLCRGTTCYGRCTGTGISGPGACRPGFICTDSDSTPSNNNNYCAAGCANSSECSGSGSGYGCNPFSKRCGIMDRGLGRYGAPCTANNQCESSLCVTGPDFPGGYCFGICRGDTENCATGGICNYETAQGDNFGICYQACSTSSNCRQSEHYNCWGPSSDPFGTCRCLTPGEVSGSNCGLCCSGLCSFSTCD